MLTEREKKLLKAVRWFIKKLPKRPVRTRTVLLRRIVKQKEQQQQQ